MSKGENFLLFEINLHDQSEILIVNNAPNFDIDPYIEFTPISDVQNVTAEVETINLRGYFHSIAPAVWRNGEKGGYSTRVVMIRQGTSMVIKHYYKHICLINKIHINLQIFNILST